MHRSDLITTVTAISVGFSFPTQSLNTRGNIERLARVWWSRPLSQPHPRQRPAHRQKCIRALARSAVQAHGHEHSAQHLHSPTQSLKERKDAHQGVVVQATISAPSSSASSRLQNLLR